MEDVFVCISWLEEEERKLIWLRAFRLPWRVICTQLGISKTVASERWNTALLKIAQRVNRDPKMKNRIERKQR
jgi:Domain of unknown function (DUF6362)